MRGLHPAPKRLILLNRWPFVPNDLDTLVFRSSEPGYCCQEEDRSNGSGKRILHDFGLNKYCMESGGAEPVIWPSNRRSRIQCSRSRKSSSNRRSTLEIPDFLEWGLGSVGSSNAVRNRGVR